MKISSIEGNRQRLDGGAMFGNAPRAVWEKWIPPDEHARIPLACRCLLIELDNGEKVLCETGIGAFFEPKLAERFGVQTPDRHRLLENLADLGLRPEDIDYLILSHLHFDHAGGLLAPYDEQQPQLRLVFPKAQFLVGREAWERALYPHPRDKASFIPGLTDLLKDSGRLHLIETIDDAPAPLREHFEFIESSGHTPGQLHTLVKGPETKVFFCGDLVPGRAWVHIPITMGYDRFPEMLIDEKTRLFERALPENWLLFFTHDPEVAASRIHLSAKGRYEPIEDQKLLQRFPI